MRVYISPYAPAEARNHVRMNGGGITSPASFERKSAFPLLWDLPAEAKVGDYEWVLNGFDVTDEHSIHLVPVHRDEPWETIDAHLNRFGVQYMLGIMPTLWQLEVRYHAALRRNGIPVMMVPPINLKSIPGLFAQFPVNSVVTPLQYLPELKELLPDPKLRYLAIVGIDEAPSRQSERADILQEVHLIPGMIALFQCETLASSSPASFHPSDRFVWGWDGDRLCMTDPGGRFTNLALPRRYGIREETCSCGRTLAATDAS